VTVTDANGQSAVLQNLLERLMAGDDSARDQLVYSAFHRLERLARSMLQRYPGVQRWEQTGDVLQAGLLRLHQSLRGVKPESVRAFFGLAATQMRRVLIDLARHYYGPEGLGANQTTDAPPVLPEDTRSPSPGREPAAQTSGPASLAEWTEFHNAIKDLPDADREIFDLLWYDGLPQADAAALLNVSDRTLKRRWREVKFKVYEALQKARVGQTNAARIAETAG
jgi:RNA polymerase sigma factor (sigma-70 family)